MKTVRRSLALLLGLLLILCCAACGAQEPPAATETPAATEPPAATETPEPLPALSYPLEENTGSDAASYPYIVRTANAIWYLSAADMEAVGRDAYFEWLELVLKDQEADFDDARAVLAPWLLEEIPPVAIVTDFCSHAGEDTPFCDSAQYSKAQREIRVYHGTGRALLYEYVRYLTFSCAKREISPGFYSEGVSEYVSHFACENRMLRTSSREFWREDVKKLYREIGVWDEESDSIDPARNDLYGAEMIRLPFSDTGTLYRSVSNGMLHRTEEINQHPNADNISNEELGSLFAYLVETYGREPVFDHWDGDVAELKEVLGKDFTELYWDWAAWNTEQCEALGIVLE